jgi:hypothetical protein
MTPEILRHAATADAQLSARDGSDAAWDLIGFSLPGLRVLKRLP